MGETIEAWSTSSGFYPWFGPYSQKVYADAGKLSGDGKRVAVFQSTGTVSGRLRLRVEIVVVVGRRRLDISGRGSLGFVRRKRRGRRVRICVQMELWSMERNLVKSSYIHIRRHRRHRRHRRSPLAPVLRDRHKLNGLRRTFMRQKTDVTVIVERTTLTVTSRLRRSMDVIPRSTTTTPVRAHPRAHARRIKIGRHLHLRRDWHKLVAASCFSMVRAQGLRHVRRRRGVPLSRDGTRVAYGYGCMVQARASSRCLNGTRKLNRGGAWLRSGGNPQVIRPVQRYPFPGMVLAWRCTPTGRTTREFSRLAPRATRPSLLPTLPSATAPRSSRPVRAASRRVIRATSLQNLDDDLRVGGTEERHLTPVNYCLPSQGMAIRLSSLMMAA